MVNSAQKCSCQGLLGAMIFMWYSTLEQISQILKTFYCGTTISPAEYNHNMFYQVLMGTQTCIHQNIVQHSKFEKTDLPTTELGTTS